MGQGWTTTMAMARERSKGDGARKEEDESVKEI